MAEMSKLGAKKIVNPQRWEYEIKAAMKRSGGSIPDAAVALKISTRQLFRWLALPNFVDVVRVEKGSPRGTKKRSAEKKEEL